ncbi:MAG: hypothetical protein JWP96_313, partial [Polaromonas sp.]|nr:hypothetical protein [Polaromonas sp.]
AAGQLTAQNPSATAPSRPRGSVDTVYEASLKTSLQVITSL